MVDIILWTCVGIVIAASLSIGMAYAFKREEFLSCTKKFLSCSCCRGSSKKGDKRRQTSATKYASLNELLFDNTEEREKGRQSTTDEEAIPEEEDDDESEKSSEDDLSFFSDLLQESISRMNEKEETNRRLGQPLL